MDIFKLYRDFWDFAFLNPSKIKPNDIAIYSFAIEHCNRLGWKKRFGFPTTMVMEAIGIKSYSVYKKHFDNLIECGFFEIIEYSKNQYSANIIALKENNKATDKAKYKALDKALIKHATKQNESTQQSIDSIDKQLTINNKQITINSKPHLFKDSEFYDLEKFENQFKGTDYEFCDLKIYYESVKNWSASKGEKKIDWIATARNFMLRDKKDNKLILKPGINNKSSSKFSAIIEQTEQMKQLNKEIYGE